MTHHVGSTFKISVPIEADTMPNVTWYRDGQKLQGRANVFIETTDFMTTITIKRATVDDAGEYECVAKNDWGMSRVKSIVNIVGKFTIR